jgi:hypothetical protein
MIHKIGYPYLYGDDLTPKMAGNNRKQAVSYSVLIPSIWWHNLGFREPIQSYSPFSNEPKTAIEYRVVKTSRVNSINRGGDLGKSGPGLRAKADALKNTRKTGGGSIFVQGFTPQRQYGSRPINKPLSCRNNVKINQDQFNGNQNPAKQTNQDCTLTSEQRRNLPHSDDVIIPDQDVIIRHGQSKYKVKNHGSDFSLPSKPNEKGWLKTPRTSENIESFKDEIKKLVLRGERIEGTYRKGKPDQFSAIHFYDSVSGCNAIFKQETKEFVSAWKLTQGQVNDLLTNKNIGDY